MIDGLKIELPSAELKTLLEGRLKYHQQKVDAYQAQRAQLEKIEVTLGEEARRMGKSSNASPLENVEDAIKRHQNQTVYYKFMAEHVIPNETYRLCENDLHRLGVSERAY